MTPDEPREMTQEDWQRLEDIQRRHDESLEATHEACTAHLRTTGWVSRTVAPLVTEWSYRTADGWLQFLLPDDPTLFDYPIAMDRALQVLKARRVPPSTETPENP
jgi:hypothetical protein